MKMLTKTMTKNITIWIDKTDYDCDGHTIDLDIVAYYSEEKGLEIEYYTWDDVEIEERKEES